MKGPKELKKYVSKYREHLKAIHFDDLLVFKCEACKKWYNRQKFKKFDVEER